MYKLALALLTVLSLLIETNTAYAGSFCDRFNSSTVNDQKKDILYLLDQNLKDFPQHLKMQTKSSDSERIAKLMTNLHRDITAACKGNNDFLAGSLLGEEVGVYKCHYIKK